MSKKVMQLVIAITLVLALVTPLAVSAGAPVVPFVSNLTLTPSSPTAGQDTVAYVLLYATASFPQMEVVCNYPGGKQTKIVGPMELTEPFNWYVDVWEVHFKAPLAPGNYQVTAGASDGSVQKASFNIPFPPNWGITGIVFDKNGNRVQGVTATATSLGRTVATSTTNNNGVWGIYQPGTSATRQFEIAFSRPVTGTIPTGLRDVIRWDNNRLIVTPKVIFNGEMRLTLSQ